MRVLFILLVCVAPALGRYMPFIIGGGYVDPPGKWPWQASLQRDRGGGEFRHSCGASIVTSTHLVSAAHCLSQSVSSYRIIVGMHDKDTRVEGNPTTISLHSFIRHPHWIRNSSLGFPNDVAVIRLMAPVDLNSPYMGTIKLAAQDNPEGTLPDFRGQECWITGWGRLYGFGPLPNLLQEAPVDIIDEEICNYMQDGRIRRIHICVGNEQGTVGACNGDSGGPLACRVNGEWILAGITSFVYPGCLPEHFSVYVRVSYYRNWIDQYIPGLE